MKGNTGTPMVARRRKNKRRKATAAADRAARAEKGRKQIAQGEVIDGILELPEIKPGKRRGMV